MMENFVPSLINLKKSLTPTTQELQMQVEGMLQQINNKLKLKTNLVYHYSQRLDMLEMMTHSKWKLQEHWYKAMGEGSNSNLQL